MKKLFPILLSIISITLFSTGIFAADTKFVDVPVKCWYHDAVYYCAENDIMLGTGDRCFSPGTSVSRAMAVTVLGRDAGIDPSDYPENYFIDTGENLWYSPYVNWAQKNNIAEGTGNNCFSPNKNITREELMTILFRYAKYRGKDISVNGIPDRYLDKDSVSPWASDAVAWCIQTKLVNGTSPSTVSPATGADRAQLSKILTVWISGREYRYHYRPVAGLKTLKNLLNTALEPVGTTMYVWGGGWNENDTKAGPSATAIGVSPKWKAFFEQQTKDYDYRKTRYQIEDGLDCSGYIGWLIYNVMETDNGKEGYVMHSSVMAKTFASYGWGTYIPAEKLTAHKAGDIMSTSGHVYLSLGECADGSVLLIHSSPKGVIITGTVTPKGNRNSEAITLSNYYMSRYFPIWYSRYPDSSRTSAYLTQYNAMRWDLSGKRCLSDPDGFAEMTPQEILEQLLGY